MTPGDVELGVTQIDAVLLDMRMRSEGEDAHTRLWLASDGTTFEAIAPGHDGPWLWMMLSRVTVGRLTLLHVPGQDCPVVTGYEEGGVDGFLEHVPETTCPTAGCLRRVAALVGGIRTPPLRSFVEVVLADRDVHDGFWVQPASLRHHHAYRGGLATHSLEVASDIACQGALTPTERDLGIAAALLHDIGKVWSYDGKRSLRPASHAMGHELLGLARLTRPLVQLEAEWPDGAQAMWVLLSGQAHRRPDGSLPYALAQRIRACDQRSVERALSATSWRGRRGWAPRPYRAEAAAGTP